MAKVVMFVATTSTMLPCSIYSTFLQFTTIQQHSFRHRVLVLVQVLRNEREEEEESEEKKN